MLFSRQSPEPRRRRRGPLVERLESRDLLSVVPLFMAHRAAVNSGPSVQAILANSANAAEAAAGNNGTASTATPQPTARELLRQRYVAKVSGTYTTGPGRYTDQLMQGSVLAAGNSNQSFNMDLQLRYFVFTDPTQPITGVAALIPRNSGTTGSNLILDLTATPPSVPGQLPTHFTWKVDSTSGGLYTNANSSSPSSSGSFGTGQGTLDIHYAPSGRGRGGVTSKGKVFIIVHGSINADGIFSNIGTLGNRP